MKITEALVAEHRIFLSVFDQIERALPTLTTLAEVRTLATVVEGLLGTHGETEQNLAFRALDHLLAEQGRLDRLYHDHQEIDARLRQASAATETAAACELLKVALSAARQHFKYEEKQVFPLLESVLHQETLTELGCAWLKRHEPLPAVS